MIVEGSIRPDRSRPAPWRPAVEALEDRTVPTAMVAVTNANELFLFDSATPGQGQVVRIQGLQEGETFRAVDYRAAAGKLVGLTYFHNFYWVDVNTGETRFEADLRGAVPDFNSPNSDGDIDPVTGQFRVVTEGIVQAGGVLRAFNYRINLSSFVIAEDPELNNGGQIVQTLAGLAYPPGGGNPYVIDVGEDHLARLNPADGEVTQGGSLGVRVEEASFDIAPDGRAFAMLGRFNDSPRLYTINLQQGNATDLGVIGNLSALDGRVIEIAALSPKPNPPPPPPQPLLGDVTDMVDAVSVKVKPKKGARKRVERWTFTNPSGNPILAPLRLIVERLGGKIKLLNRAGALKVGKGKIEPYLTWYGGTLAAGQSVTFTLEFSVPDGVGLRYGWRLTAGGV